MSFMNVLSLLGGLGLFLFGMKIMGDGLERAAGNRLKKLLGIVTRNRVLAMLAGIVITAVIQSSSATTVMVVGFVNAALISLTQAVGVIMGANIGTTVTSLILAVKIDFAAVFACIGLLLTMLPKKYHTARQFGDIALGLGILFVGMNTMSAAMKPLQEWEGFRNAMAGVNHPVLGVGVGAVITAVIQSSSASVGILQALAGEGLIELRAAMFILFGQNIGTCVTALLACSGTNTNAKRAAMVHLLFNVIGAVMFTVITVLLPLDQWIISLAPDNLRLQIAFVHIIFNVTTTALLLPLARVLEKIACLLVREKTEAEAAGEPMRLKFFDTRLLNTPPIAAAQLFKEVQRMGEVALSNLQGAMACFDHWDDERAGEIARNEEVLDYLNSEITSCLVEVRGLDLNEKDAHMVGTLFHVVNDWERVGDHAVNVLDAARLRHNEEIKFSSKAVAELENLFGKVQDQLNTAVALFLAQSSDPAAFRAVEAVEQEIDDLTDALRDHHLDRIKNKKCSAKNGMLYMDILTNLERIGDHAENIATSTKQLVPVGGKW